MIYNKLNLKCIPKPIFAHVYSCPGYKSHFKKPTPNIEIAYVKEGRLELEIFGEKHFVEEKSFLVLPHNYDSYICAKNNEPHIHYTVSVMMNKESILTKDKDCITNEDEIIVPLIISENSKTKTLENTLYKAINEYQKEDIISKLKCGSLFAYLLGELASSGTELPKISSTKADILDKRIKKYIEKNIHTKILLSDIADALGKNKNYLNEVFTKLNNTSIISYVNHMKMKKLAVLIADKGYSVKEAASCVGMNDVNYVSKIFKQKMGMSISEYKSASVDYTFSLSDKNKY